jgi:hypothetical protein
VRQVVKASKGHIPQPFLISNVEKNCGKDKREMILTAKIIFGLTLRLQTTTIR